jgi:hypothetical protein
MCPEPLTAPMRWIITSVTRRNFGFSRVPCGPPGKIQDSFTQPDILYVNITSAPPQGRDRSFREARGTKYTWGKKSRNQFSGTHRHVTSFRRDDRRVENKLCYILKLQLLQVRCKKCKLIVTLLQKISASCNTGL